MVRFLNSPELLAKILELADDAIITVDDQQRILMFNHGAERVFGYTFQEVSGEPLDVLLPVRFVAAHRQHVAGFAESPVNARRMGERREILALRKDGTEFPAEASISKTVGEHGPMFTVILRDITQRVANEERIRTSLREKEALLREIHHRVKNNLQVVSSLLNLQARGVSEDSTRRMFEESRNRILSMSLLHESLYQSSSLSRIDFAEYIQQLASHLFRSYGASADRIRYRPALDKLFLNLDAAVPCGLIINELVSNALKYAFPDNRAGEIRIEFRELPGDKVRLIVADDGIGIGNKMATAKTLGLRLVHTLAEQLDAKVEVISPPGTEIRLTFSLPIER